MPKIRTHSASKKRFSFTASGKLKSARSHSNHFKRNLSKSSLRNRRGTAILSESDSKLIRKKMMPYGCPKRGLGKNFLLDKPGDSALPEKSEDFSPEKILPCS